MGAFSLMMMPSSDEDDEDERLDDVELGHDALDLDRAIVLHRTSTL